MADIKETATAVNFTLKKLVSLQKDLMEGARPSSVTNGNYIAQSISLKILNPLFYLYIYY